MQFKIYVKKRILFNFEKRSQTGISFLKYYVILPYMDGPLYIIEVKKLHVNNNHKVLSH